MKRHELMEAMGLSEDDTAYTHRLEFLERGQYTREEIAALDTFWAGIFTQLGGSREEILQRFLRYLPQRGEESFTGWMTAMWDDGLRGPFYAKMLGREPEEPNEE